MWTKSSKDLFKDAIVEPHPEAHPPDAAFPTWDKHAAKSCVMGREGDRGDGAKKSLYAAIDTT